MHRRLIVIFVLLSLALPLWPTAAFAQSGITATGDQATIQFPESITFSVDLKSESEINRVVLEYGVQQLTCGTVVGKAFPKLTPGKSLAVKWTWEMKQSGSLPPGATIWWRWHAASSDGKELVTDRQTITWLDSSHRWQKLGGQQATLHWYTGSQAFAAELRDSADKALTNLAETTGLQADGSIDLYIYANSNDLREAILYEPGWVGGVAFSPHNIVIIGIPTNQLEWGKQTIAHELTHVLVGRYTFSCLGDEPTWLNEGLAMHGQGGPDLEAERQFKAAVTDDKLMSVRALSGGFAEARDKADLSYSQSHSLVSFLIKEYGQDKMLQLLRALRDGTPIDEAMKSLYGFDSDGFEDAWRAKIGAKPRSAIGRTAATPTPTLVPTIVPVAGVVTPSPIPTQTSTPLPATATPISTPSPTALATPTSQPAASIPIVTLILGAVVLIVVVVTVIVILRARK